MIHAGITKAEDSIERYLSAFEAGTLSDTQCGQRIEGLAAKVTDLRTRRDELLAAIDQEAAGRPTLTNWPTCAIGSRSA